MPVRSLVVIPWLVVLPLLVMHWFDVVGVVGSGVAV